MTGSPILDLLLKSLAVMLAGSASGALLIRSSATHRCRVWTVTFAGVLILPLLTAALPTWRAPWSAPHVAGHAPPDASPVPVTVPAGVAAVTTVRAGVPARRVDWRLVAVLAWGGGLVVLGGGLVRSHVLARRCVRRATPCSDPAWIEDCRRVASGLGLRRPVSLFVSTEIGVPMTCGWCRPAVLLPRGVERWSAQRRRYVLMHEVMHVRRSDCLYQLLSRVVLMAHWFNPVAWWLTRRFDLDRERRCDEQVITFGADPAAYASHLLAIARSCRRSDARLAALPLACRPQLETRLMSILEHVQKRPRRSALVPCMILAAAVVVLASMRPGHAAVMKQKPVHPSATESPAAVDPQPRGTVAREAPAGGAGGLTVRGAPGFSLRGGLGFTTPRASGSTGGGLGGPVGHAPRGAGGTGSGPRGRTYSGGRDAPSGFTVLDDAIGAAGGGGVARGIPGGLGYAVDGASGMAIAPRPLAGAASRPRALDGQTGMAIGLPRSIGRSGPAPLTWDIDADTLVARALGEVRFDPDLPLGFQPNTGSQLELRVIRGGERHQLVAVGVDDGQVGYLCFVDGQASVFDDAAAEWWGELVRGSGLSARFEGVLRAGVR